MRWDSRVRSKWLAGGVFLALGMVLGCCQQLPVDSSTHPPAGGPVGAAGPSPSEGLGLSEEEIRTLLPDGDSRDGGVVTVRYLYSCQGMVAMVNGLRHLGKGRALDILAQFDAQHTDVASQMRVICICRVLFLPPTEGWAEPWGEYRAAVPNYMLDTGDFKEKAKSKFPLYPMAISDGVPFLLTSGYSSAMGGRAPPIPDEANATVDRCRDLDMIQADRPTAGFVRAAERLISSDAFAGLLEGSDGENADDRSKSAAQLEDDILNQADGRFRVHSGEQPPAESGGSS